jgi:hypothetical protein
MQKSQVNTYMFWKNFTLNQTYPFYRPPGGVLMHILLRNLIMTMTFITYHIKPEFILEIAPDMMHSGGEKCHERHIK